MSAKCNLISFHSRFARQRLDIKYIIYRSYWLYLISATSIKSGCPAVTPRWVNDQVLNLSVKSCYGHRVTTLTEVPFESVSNTIHHRILSVHLLQPVTLTHCGSPPPLLLVFPCPYSVCLVSFSANSLFLSGSTLLQFKEMPRLSIFHIKVHLPYAVLL